MGLANQLDYINIWCSHVSSMLHAWQGLAGLGLLIFFLNWETNGCFVSLVLVFLYVQPEVNWWFRSVFHQNSAQSSKPYHTLNTKNRNLLHIFFFRKVFSTSFSHTLGKERFPKTTINLCQGDKWDRTNGEARWEKPSIEGQMSRCWLGWGNSWRCEMPFWR